MAPLLIHFIKGDLMTKLIWPLIFAMNMSPMTFKGSTSIKGGTNFKACSNRKAGTSVKAGTNLKVCMDFNAGTNLKAGTNF